MLVSVISLSVASPPSKPCEEKVFKPLAMKHAYYQPAPVTFRRSAAAQKDMSISRKPRQGVTGYKSALCAQKHKEDLATAGIRLAHQLKPQITARLDDVVCNMPENVA